MDWQFSSLCQPSAWLQKNWLDSEALVSKQNSVLVSGKGERNAFCWKRNKKIKYVQMILDNC